MSEPGTCEVKEASEQVIDSTNMLNFLLNVGSFPTEPTIDQFSKKLELPWLGQQITEFTLQLKEGNEYLPEVIKQSNRKAAAVLANIGLGEAAHEIEARNNRTGPLEATAQIYYDTKESIIKISKVNHGTGFGVTSPVGSGYLEGGLPLIDLHNHPESQLFSPADYAEMLLAFQDDRRLIRGMVVLCPEGQLLALATRDTPKFTDWKDGFAMIDRLKAEQEESHVGMMTPFEELKMAILSGHADLCARESQIISSLGSSENDVCQSKSIIEESTRKSIELLDTTVVSQVNISSKLINQQGIATAHEMGVVLYWATDGGHFTKFSA